MELPEDSMLWAFTILILIVTISISLVVQQSRNGDIAETAKKNVQTPKAQHSKALAYRLRGVPSNLEQRDLKELVKRVLVLEDDITIDVNSLAADPSRHGEKIATLEFSKTPGSLSKQADNAEWKFSIHDNKLNDRKITLLFDTHFRGLTPLHSRSDAECTIDLIAVSGLGSHAFGSFKERKGSHMWLRDSLAHDNPNMRILIYGYDTQMYCSTSFANLDDLANEFQERIKSIRNYPRLRRSEIPTTSPERPLIFIGHSLGGIIIKAALIRMNDGDDSDKANFKSVCGMLFFGVPNQGMPISQWIPIGEGQPNRFFIEQLCASSDILRVFRTDFRKMFTFRDSKIYSFYETKESPTAQRRSDGKWELTGPCIKLVDTASATHGRSWEEGGSYIKPIHRTHSDLVKFSQIDDDYTTVSNCLLEFSDTACDTTMKRFLSAQEILQLSIDSVSVDRFFQLLPIIDQEHLKSTIPLLDRDRPEYSWVFKNLDFQHWETAGRSQILWLYGPPECNLHHVSSYVANETFLTAQRTVLYFFCSSIANGELAISHFILTLLFQFARHSPKDRQKSIVGNFLRTLVKAGTLKKEKLYTESDLFKDSSGIWVNVIFDTPSDTLWSALMATLADEPERELWIIVDGLEKVQDEKGEFIKGIRAFVYLLQQRTLNLKVLLTSRPQADIKEALDGLLYIEHDKERRECRASLYFENSRYGKISKEHEGSLEWIWTHDQYKEWSKPDASRFLYLQGKPGSGKSTLTRYFRENLSERDPDAKSAMVAKFFYSDRDGELQRSHYNMLRCILYEILGQHEALFYRYFQSEYRDQKLLQEQSSSGPVEWGYESLKRTFSSISDFSPAKRLYIIIDAVDESDDDDRREILNLMFNLCSKSKDCMIKIFLASRPIGILQKNNAREFFGSKFLSIKLQDQTKPDIARFANSFLKDLEFSSFLKQATKYIVENAQGVFLWVQLVKKELLAYDEAGRCAEKDIFEFLKSLPTELEEFYQRMLNKMGRNRADIRDGIKMFQLVLFARRPLAVTELLHALAIPGESGAEFTISNDSFRNSIPPERRITHCGGNFLEIRRSFGTITYEDSTTERDSVQVMHQTVRDFFLRSNGLVATSDFRMSGREAHICISITCIRYLILCASNIAERFPNLKSWTSQHFKDCAQYLHEMPFLNYTLQYLNHHINSCHNDAYVLDITSKFIDELTISPAAYLLQDWVPSCFDNTPFIIKLDDTILDIQSRILLAAVRDGYLIAAKICLAVGAGLNMIEKKAMTPLHHAADNGHEAMASLLLTYGADPERKDDDGWTPLSWAATNGHKAVVKLLLERGADPESKEYTHGQTPLSWAASNGHEGVVRVLLESGANLEPRDKFGQTPLSWAAENGHETVVKVLLDKGADPESIEYGYGGRTPLSWAAANGHEGVVRVLLDKGADSNSMNDFGQSPLHHAAENGHEAVVRLMLESGSNLESKEYEYGGRTPLSWAAENGHEAVVRLLLSKGAYLESKEHEYGGRTPLAWAEENGHEAVMKLLLENSTDIESEDEYNGSTSLSWVLR